MASDAAAETIGEHMMSDPDSNAISIEQFAQQIAPQLAQLLADRLPDSFKAASDLIALAVDPKAVKRNLRALHDAMAAASAAQVKLAADRAAFDEYKAKETAELEQQRKTAGSTWAMVKSREAAVEQREEHCDARERELGSRGGYRPPRNHPDFTPIEGTTITRSPERPPPVPSDAPPPEQERTVVRVGRAGTSLAQSVETPVRRRGAAQHA
jgi:hypothetical protein